MLPITDNRKTFVFFSLFATSLLLLLTAFQATGFPQATTDAAPFEKLTKTWKSAYDQVLESIYFECETLYPDPKLKNFKTIRREGLNYCSIANHSGFLNTPAASGIVMNQSYTSGIEQLPGASWKIKSMKTQQSESFQTNHRDMGILQTGLNPYSVLNMICEGDYTVTESSFDSGTGDGYFKCEFDLESALTKDISKRGDMFARAAEIYFNLNKSVFPVSYNLTIVRNYNLEKQQVLERRVATDQWKSYKNHLVPSVIGDKAIIDGREIGLTFQLSQIRDISAADREYFSVAKFGLPEPKGFEAARDWSWIYLFVFGIFALVFGKSLKSWVSKNRGAA